MRTMFGTRNTYICEQTLHHSTYTIYTQHCDQTHVLCCTTHVCAYIGYGCIVSCAIPNLVSIVCCVCTHYHASPSPTTMGSVMWTCGGEYATTYFSDCIVFSIHYIMTYRHICNAATNRMSHPNLYTSPSTQPCNTNQPTTPNNQPLPNTNTRKHLINQPTNQPQQHNNNAHNNQQTTTTPTNQPTKPTAHKQIKQQYHTHQTHTNNTHNIKRHVLQNHHMYMSLYVFPIPLWGCTLHLCICHTFIFGLYICCCMSVLYFAFALLAMSLCRARSSPCRHFLCRCDAPSSYVCVVHLSVSVV